MSAIGELCSAVASWQRDGIGDADTIAARRNTTQARVR